MTKLNLIFDRFIEKYGTHIIVGLGIGGQDTVVVRQDKTSNLEASELKKSLDELGDQLFNGTCNFTPKNQKHKVSCYMTEYYRKFMIRPQN